MRVQSKEHIKATIRLTLVDIDLLKSGRSIDLSNEEIEILNETTDIRITGAMTT